MKIKGFLLHTGLTVTVIISVILTTIILTNPATFQRDSKTTTSPGENDATASNKTLSDIYAPVQVILNQDRQQYQLDSSKVSLVNKLRTEIRKWKVSDTVTKTALRNEEEYVAFLEQKNAVVLNYSDHLTIKLFNKTFSKTIKKYHDDKYNRILIPLKQKKVMYLLNDQAKTIYKLELRNENIRKTAKIAENNKSNRLQVEYYLLDGYLTMFYLNTVQVPHYTYLINKANASSFVTQLLDSNGGNSITTKMQKDKIIYSDGADNRMTVEDPTNRIKYANYSNSDYNNSVIERQSFNDHLKRSFTKLNIIGTSLDDVHYSEFNQVNGTVIYRSYVAGFPIINENNYGAFKIQTLSSGGLKYDFSLLSLQVPVPSGGKSVTLPPTVTVYQNLINAGYSANKLKNIQIGYSWRKNEASSLVIDLVPTYFVNYNGKWTEYNKLLNSTSNSGN
ncbi:YycH family regulatory protein [Liquorilactobacillus capillatus]|uniref:YycH family protein n=1 Tax=Liquorilactobacillus capillatus DSM 19910 TaxID=1423731 RepID=A0A0R1M2V7_9LACO|nr:two-component system activity regulator YycH [Liquorilactobacillus capillatus]KRL02367.1 YycH family protein [Liquorilactobacillus capillatus DSM 19910]